MDERTLKEALIWARIQEARIEAAEPYTKQQMGIDPQVGVNRALLVAARLFVEHEWIENYDRGYDMCSGGCGASKGSILGFPDEPHKKKCAVGQWARAAREAGLE